MNEQGLVPVIIQDTLTNKILMMAWMNTDALVKTIELSSAISFQDQETNYGLKGEDSDTFILLTVFRLTVILILF